MCRIVRRRTANCPSCLHSAAPKPHLAVSHGAVRLQDGAAAAAARAGVCAHLLAAAPDEGSGLRQSGAAAEVVQQAVQVIITLQKARKEKQSAHAAERCANCVASADRKGFGKC